MKLTRPVDLDAFDQFWKMYPKRVAKAAAVKAWRTLNPDPSLIVRMLSALVLHKQTQQWRKDRGTYIPNPATWLNGERWNDEIEPVLTEHRCPHAPACGTTPEWPEATPFRCQQRSLLEAARAGNLESV